MYNPRKINLYFYVQKNRMSKIPSFNHADKMQVLHMAGNPIGNLSKKIFQENGIIKIQKVKNLAVFHN